MDKVLDLIEIQNETLTSLYSPVYLSLPHCSLFGCIKTKTQGKLEKSETWSVFRELPVDLVNFH